MAIRNKIQKIIPSKTTYPEFDLEKFGEEIKPYRIDAFHPFTNKPFKYLSVGAEFKYLKDKGIVKVYGEITDDIKSISKLPEWEIIDTMRHTEHNNKISQYFSWAKQKQNKLDFAQKKQMEYYEKKEGSIPILGLSANY